MTQVSVMAHRLFFILFIWEGVGVEYEPASLRMIRFAAGRCPTGDCRYDVAARSRLPLTLPLRVYLHLHRYANACVLPHAVLPIHLILVIAR